MKTRRYILKTPQADHVYMDGPEEDHMINPWKSGHFYEEGLLLDIWKMNIEGTYLDIGASLGNHAVFFGHVCGSRVLAFEPQPQAYRLLRSNLGRNVKDFESHYVAIGNAYQTVSLEQTWDRSIGSTKVVEGDGVPMIALDDLVSPDEPVALIKVDVEGFEANVLQSGRALIEAQRPLIFAECFGDAALGEVHRVLAPMNYTVDPTHFWNATPTYLWKPVR